MTVQHWATHLIGTDGATACGLYHGRPMTYLPGKVTCGSCERTPAYLQAAEGQRRELARTPGAVVVDTRDGATFSRGADGLPFTLATAERFARERNAACKPEYRTYRVFLLTPA